MLVRRVVGESMLPSLRPGQLIFARTYFKKLRPGDIVVVRHNGIEKIKRISWITADAVMLQGDNPTASTDSRHFGAIARQYVIAKLFLVGP